MSSKLKTPHEAEKFTLRHVDAIESCAGRRCIALPLCVGEPEGSSLNIHAYAKNIDLRARRLFLCLC